jgi:hypothetical protein
MSCNDNNNDLYVKTMETKYSSIMDIAPEQANNTKGLCICDKCKKTFEANEILMESVNNIQFQGLLSVKGITKGKNTWYLVSPCCKETHLFGFDLKPKQNEKTSN